MNSSEGLSKVSRVVHYLYGCIRRGDKNNDHLPGESELCRKFGFARGTVQRAVNGLMQEKFILKKPGRHGLYINPDMICRVPFSIGVVMNKGISEIASGGAANAYAGFIKAVTADADMEFLFHNLLEADFRSIGETVTNYGVQGLLWIISDRDDAAAFDAFNAVTEQNFPAVAVGYSFDSNVQTPLYNTVTRDYTELGERLAEFIRKKGYTRPLLIGEDQAILHSFMTVFGEDVPCFTQKEDPAGELTRLLETKKYDCVISGGGYRRYGLLAKVMNRSDYTRSLPLILRNYFLTKRFAQENPALKIILLEELSAQNFMFRSGEAAGRMFLKLMKDPALKMKNLSLRS